MEVILTACENATNATVTEMFNKIVDRTPVGDPSLWKQGRAPIDYVPGTLKASWELNYSNSTRDFSSGQFAKASSVVGAGGLKMNVKGDQIGVVTISNRQPYAYRIEAEGWSTQAPEGMMRRTVIEFEDILTKHARNKKV